MPTSSPSVVHPAKEIYRLEEDHLNTHLTSATSKTQAGFATNKWPRVGTVSVKARSLGGKMLTKSGLFLCHDLVEREVAETLNRWTRACGNLPLAQPWRGEVASFIRKTRGFGHDGGARRFVQK